MDSVCAPHLSCPYPYAPQALRLGEGWGGRLTETIMEELTHQVPYLALDLFVLLCIEREKKKEDSCK